MPEYVCGSRRTIFSGRLVLPFLLVGAGSLLLLSGMLKVTLCYMQRFVWVPGSNLGQQACAASHGAHRRTHRHRQIDSHTHIGT